MNNPFKKYSINVIIPILIGAAVVSAITCLLLSDNCVKLRKSISESFIKGWNTVNENNPV